MNQEKKIRSAGELWRKHYNVHNPDGKERMDREHFTVALSAHDNDLAGVVEETQQGRKLKEDKLESRLIEMFGKKMFDKDYYILGWEDALTEILTLLRKEN